MESTSEKREKEVKSNSKPRLEIFQTLFQEKDSLTNRGYIIIMLYIFDLNSYLSVDKPK